MQNADSALKAAPSVFHQIIRQQQRFGRQVVCALHVSCLFGGLGLLHVLANLTDAVLLAWSSSGGTKSVSGWRRLRPAIGWCFGAGSRPAPRSCRGELDYRDPPFRRCALLFSPERQWKRSPSFSFAATFLAGRFGRRFWLFGFAVFSQRPARLARRLRFGMLRWAASGARILRSILSRMAAVLAVASPG